MFLGIFLNTSDCSSETRVRIEFQIRGNFFHRAVRLCDFMVFVNGEKFFE